MPKWNKCINEEGCSANVEGQEPPKEAVFSGFHWGLSCCRVKVTFGRPVTQISTMRMGGSVEMPVVLGLQQRGLTRVSAPHSASPCLSSRMESRCTGQAEDPAAVPGAPRVSSSCCCPHPCPPTSPTPDFTLQQTRLTSE